MIEPSLGTGHGADGVGLPPLFFRAADRLRLEGCVAGLLRDGRSLAVSSTRDAALDHYSRLLISRLRESAPQSPPELYFPADTTAMINRFNDVVSALSVQEAMEAGPLLEPARIWVVHDAGALANHEVQLLARLVQNFPGANIRVVFLLGPSTQSRNMFDTMDRRFLRWDIEAPTPEQAEAMLAQGREDGCEGVVRSLLKKLEAPVPGSAAAADPAGIDPLGFQGARAGAGVGASGTAADVFKFSGQGADVGAADKAGNANSKKDSKGKNAHKGKEGKDKSKAPKPSVSLGNRLRAVMSWVFIFLALASLSVGVTAWLHPSVFTLDRLDMAKRWAMSLAAAPAAKALTPAAPVEPAAMPEAAASAPAEAASAPSSSSASSSSSAAESDASAAAGTAPVPALVAPVAVASPATPDPVDEPPSEALSGQAWIQPMPFGTWVVQHAAMPSYQAAQKWQQSVPALADARIVALYRPNDKLAYFAVVSGPFTSRALATTFAARKGVPADAWVRSARSLKEQFSPNKSQESRR